MRMTAILTQTERKPQDRFVRRAEKRSRQARMLRVHGTIRPTSDFLRDHRRRSAQKRLFNWRNQAILTSDSRPFGGCRFNWAVVASNDQRFCISCHVMRDNAYAEFQGTAHHITLSGVGATCSDYQVPRQWLPKIVRKGQGVRAYRQWLGQMA